MKTFIYYILLVFGVFLTKPIHGHSLESKYINSSSFEKTEQKLSFSSSDLKKSFFFANEDVFNEDDDDDVAGKKKITFVPVTFLSNIHYFIKPFPNHLRNVSCYNTVCKLPLFEFISLSVLKI